MGHTRHLTPPIALTIAGSDSGGGAGIQADLKTFAAHGVYGTCAITALTAQNTRRVSAVEVSSTSIVRAQIDAVTQDFPVRAVKTGMLATAALVRAVGQALAGLAIPHVVVDPVMIAKSGDSLLDMDAIDALRTALFPRATVVTPNIPEAEALSGLTIRSEADAEAAARRIAGFGARMVVVKGGHAETSEIVDVLFDGTSVRRFRHERVPGTSTHGTGCTFAAALAAHLALGRTLGDALPLAQRYVAGAIRHAPRVGEGHGPMEHFWELKGLG